MPTVGGFKRRAPKNARSRRILKKMESKVFENAKTVLFLQGERTSQVILDTTNDLNNILKPHTKKLKKKNAFHPFDGVEHLEFLAFKNDCSLFCFGSDSKKRPHNLVLGRHFEYHLLDMIEFGVVAQDRLIVGDAKGTSAASIGSRPLFVFEGSEFDADPFFVNLKNFFLDFFGAASTPAEINMEGVDRVVFVSLRSETGSDAVVAPSNDAHGAGLSSEKGNAVVCLRHFALVKNKGATSAITEKSVGNVTLVDVGPNLDLQIRRVRFCTPADLKRASRVPREVLSGMKSLHDNVTTDELGNLRGQLHVGKQDTSRLALRRFASQKRGRNADERIPADAPKAASAPPTNDDERPKKKVRKHNKDSTAESVAVDADI